MSVFSYVRVSGRLARPVSSPWHPIVFLSALGVQLTESAVGIRPTSNEQVVESAGAASASPAQAAYACYVLSVLGVKESLNPPPPPTRWLVNAPAGEMYSTTRRLPATESPPVNEVGVP